MGLISSFQAANIWGQVAFVVLLVAEVFNWLCFCMNDWGLYDTNPTNADDELGFGVWRLCGRTEPDSLCQDLDGWRLTWYGAFQGFMVFGFMGVNLALFFVILVLFVPQCNSNKETRVFSIVSAIVAVICYIVALVLFGVKFDETYDAGFDTEEYFICFYFAIVVAVLSLVVAICLVIGISGGHSIGHAPSSGPSTGGEGSGGSNSKGHPSKK
ncbi:uncharacterized protein LOC101864520 [Aplysia californica]|uniref:Uncharacterized protein LOC101864520 n=1 Tax=Aplysia californica TaxID=6500 RepID=A0ABM0JM01_APLCA|nr:uncharacterized protein LOC101864520 [Aplysia californica]